MGFRIFGIQVLLNQTTLMKTLLIYPKFPPSYWSYEGLLKLIGRKAFVPPLGLITVAALLPQDWEFRVVDCNANDVSEDDWQWADIVMLSGMLVQKHNMLALIREAKSRDKLVAVGGPYVTSVPQDVEQAGADFIVLDEGEITIPLLVEALERGETCGRFDAGGEKADMNTSPIPRYDLLDFGDYSEMSLQFSRGCPFLCEFCDIIVLYGRRPRTKSPEQVVAEMQRIYDLGWRRSMFVVDDNFIGNKRNVKPVLEAMADWQVAHDYPFSLTTEASVNLGDDKELLDLMVRAYFGVVFLGIETPDADSLALTKKSQNIRRPMTTQIRNISEAGIRVMGSFIIGFDGEKAGAGGRIAKFVDETAIPHVMVSMLQALPLTHLMDRLKLEKRLFDEKDHANLNQSCLTNFLPTRPLRELASEHIDCNMSIYEPQNFIDRTYRHCLTLGRRPRRRKSPPPEWRELMVALILFWRHGIQRASRWQFWGAIFKLARRNPQAVRTFVICCAHFEHFYEYREQIRNDIQAQLAGLSSEELDRFVGSDTPVEALKITAMAV